MLQNLSSAAVVNGALRVNRQNIQVIIQLQEPKRTSIFSPFLLNQQISEHYT